MDTHTGKDTQTNLTDSRTDAQTHMQDQVTTPGDNRYTHHSDLSSKSPPGVWPGVARQSPPAALPVYRRLQASRSQRRIRVGWPDDISTERKLNYYIHRPIDNGWTEETTKLLFLLSQKLDKFRNDTSDIGFGTSNH